MITESKTSKNKNRLRNVPKIMVIAAIVTSMMLIIVGIDTSQTFNSKTLVYAQEPEGSYIQEVIGANNITKLGNVSETAVPIITVDSSTSTEKEFWINTMHLDGNTNLKAGSKCDSCAQNTPSHPAEKPPLNSTLPAGGGFRLTEPNKVGAWDFRSFAFSQSQIVVNQGDKVTLHFVGVQGAHHFVKIDGIGDFPLSRGQIHTVSFIASHPGTITYICTLHMPNMVGQILVLPKNI